MYQTHFQILVTLASGELLEYDVDGEISNFSADRDWAREQLRNFVKEANQNGGVFESGHGAFYPMSQVKEIGMTVPKSWGDDEVKTVLTTPELPTVDSAPSLEPVDSDS